MFILNANHLAIYGTNQEITVIQGCLKGDPKSQQMLYRTYYSYAMSVCLSYASDKDEAKEILSDSFLKVFTHLGTYDPERPFKSWLRRTIVNTAIDYYRRNKKNKFHVELGEAHAEEADPGVIDQLSTEEILLLLRQLPERYRLAFNLYELEGYTHEEIGSMLDIPESTSRANLARAKKKLREMVIALSTVPVAIPVPQSKRM